MLKKSVPAQGILASGFFASELFELYLEILKIRPWVKMSEKLLDVHSDFISFLLLSLYLPYFITSMLLEFLSSNSRRFTNSLGNDQDKNSMS